VLDASLASELSTLARQLDRLAQKRRRSRDYTLTGLRDALREVIACFPVYRSYVADGEPTDADRRPVEVAARRAAVRNRLTSPAVFRFIRDMVLLAYPDGATDADRAEQRRFAGKFQQVTSPVTAKGVEDTAFYRYHRLVSLNEVGGEPGRFGTPPDAVHKFFADRQANWPYSLSPLSTHDTKRSEDVRARLNVLSEIPDEWAAAVRGWMGLNADLRPAVDGEPAPDAGEEYLLYQTLVGAWPPGGGDPGTEFADRIKAYMVKALHEAKVRTSWVNPNAAYDAAVQEFVGKLLDPQSGRAFLDSFLPFQRRVARLGVVNTLAQTLLKLTAPGVPDTYQGTELPDFSLVDPDNRRPVDYSLRQRLLDEVRGCTARELFDSAEDGRAKLFLSWRGLHARKVYPALFTEGEYQPLAAGGAKAEHLFAFARRFGEQAAVVAVTRLPAKLTGDPARPPLGPEVWGDTRLPVPAAVWRDVLTDRQFSGESLAAGELFADLPVALLLREG
jgi:(1->4)-alpha-D-glucan 1-alpha-D-glucosylmutase